MVKKKTSINIEEDIWKKMKLHCVNKEIDISDYLEGLIKKDLKKNEKNI